jgi:anti-sigma-K factor RskA
MATETLTIEQLEHWVSSGAHWRAVAVSNAHAVVDLCACTGELVERRQSDDPAVINYLGTARSDLDLV